MFYLGDILYGSYDKAYVCGWHKKNGELHEIIV